MIKLSKTLIVFLLISIGFATISYSQEAQQTLITENFSNQSCKAILSQLQDKYRVRFFFKESELPKRMFDIQFTDQSVDDVLDQLLLNSSLGHYSYRENGIIILPVVDMETEYSAEYYAALDKSVGEPQSTSTSQTQLVSIGNISTLDASGSAIVTGRIIDDQTDEPIIGATVRWVNTDGADVTDFDGNFKTQVPSGSRELLVEYIGYQNLIQVYDVKGNGQLDLRLEKEAVGLDEVTITAQAANSNVEKAQIGVATLSVAEIKKLPAFMGEADIVKSLLLQPGVSSLGEGASGFNVRGGDVDQNLVMQDEAFFFNSSHALGFFSAFNADMVSSVDLYKGNIPSKFGGRLASVMDVKLKNGNNKRWRLKGGAGLVSSRIGLDGPIGDKITVNTGFRSSYADWVLNLIDIPEVQNSSAFFYDANVRINMRFNEKNNLTLSGYSSSDDFVYNNEFGFDYSTLIGNLSYNTTFSDNILNKFSAVYSQYKSSQSQLTGFEGARIGNDINYVKLKDELSITNSNELRIDVGGSAIYYFMKPGVRTSLGDMSTVIPKSLEDEQGLEAAAFANIELPIGDALLITGGVRLSYYQYLGAKSVFQYTDPINPTLATIGEPIQYGDGDVIASYFTPEPRLSLRLKLTDDISIKTGYSRTAQYINQIFNSDSPTPSSQWQLSTEYLKPQTSHNLSIGYFHNFADNNWETSFEVYGRQIDQLYDYRDFANLFVNEHLETELLSGEGRSYGAELSIKKKKGTYNGWLSYTYSRAERLIDGINDGNYYPSNFDKPHDLSLVLNYQPNKRNTFTVNFNYGTGRPTTAPVGNFLTKTGLFVPIYTERNQLRIPDYHRIDVAYTLGKGWKKDKRFQSSWTLSVYNIYGRRNAFSVYYDNTGARKAIANKLSILGYAFPAITFNFEII